MNPRKLAIAIASALVLATPALAQSPSTQANPNNPTGVGGSGAFSGWLSDYQAKNQGKISRQAYLDEVGRRWDMADQQKQGLTVDQINQTYGMGATGTAGLSTAPGNMGPNNVKK